MRIQQRSGPDGPLSRAATRQTDLESRAILFGDLHSRQYQRGSVCQRKKLGSEMTIFRTGSFRWRNVHGDDRCHPDDALSIICLTNRAHHQQHSQLIAKCELKGGLSRQQAIVSEAWISPKAGSSYGSWGGSIAGTSPDSDLRNSTSSGISENFVRPVQMYPGSTRPARCQESRGSKM